MKNDVLNRLFVHNANIMAGLQFRKNIVYLRAKLKDSPW